MAPPAAIVRLGGAAVNGALPQPHPHHVQPASDGERKRTVRSGSDGHCALGLGGCRRGRSASRLRVSPLLFH